MAVLALAFLLGGGRSRIEVWRVAVCEELCDFGGRVLVAQEVDAALNPAKTKVWAELDICRHCALLLGGTQRSSGSDAEYRRRLQLHRQMVIRAGFMKTLHEHIGSVLWVRFEYLREASV